MESGVLLLPKLSVPLALCEDGLTTPVMAAPYELDPEPLELLLPLPLLPPQAASNSAAAAPNAASPMVLRLLMR
jgi:hypothetical protein